MKSIHITALFVCMLATSTDTICMLLCRRSPQLQTRLRKNSRLVRFYNGGHPTQSPQYLQIQINKLKERITTLEEDNHILFENYEALSRLVYLDNHDTFILKHNMHYKNDSDK